jgi:NNP family nitrate/nitrite transporter-like MFS transporter
MVPKAYAAAMLATALIFWFFSYHDKAHVVPGSVTMKAQLQALKDPNVWKLSQYYSIVFGGYVALSLWMTKYYVTEYGFDLQAAALLAACFSLPGGVLRAIGGWLSDRHGAHPVTWWVMLISWGCLFFLSYPQTDLVVKTARGDFTFHVGLNVWMFTALMFVMGVAWAVGKASVFKYISDQYTHNIGVISGIVGLAGGMGGFLLPVMFGILVDITGVNSTIFMLMWGITLVSLIWMYWTEIVPQRAAPAGAAAAAAQRA